MTSCASVRVRQLCLCARHGAASGARPPRTRLRPLRRKRSGLAESSVGCGAVLAGGRSWRSVPLGLAEDTVAGAASVTIERVWCRRRARGGRWPPPPLLVPALAAAEREKPLSAANDAERSTPRMPAAPNGFRPTVGKLAVSAGRPSAAEKSGGIGVASAPVSGSVAAPSRPSPDADALTRAVKYVCHDLTLSEHSVASPCLREFSVRCPGAASDDGTPVRPHRRSEISCRWASNSIPTARALRNQTSGSPAQFETHSDCFTVQACP